jgi:hypothetical protein
LLVDISLDVFTGVVSQPVIKAVIKTSKTRNIHENSMLMVNVRAQIICAALDIVTKKVRLA